MSASSMRHMASERRRAVVVHEDPTAGCRLADHLAMHGYEAILTRQLEDLQPDLPKIRPDVIVVGYEYSTQAGALPHLQSVCPLVPIIAMEHPDGFGARMRDQHANAFGAGVFVCRPSNRASYSSRSQ